MADYLGYAQKYSGEGWEQIKLAMCQQLLMVGNEYNVIDLLCYSLVFVYI